MDGRQDRWVGRHSALYGALAERMQKDFQRFIKPAGGLFDVLDGPEGNDPTVRPNQIFAVSLHFSPLGESDQVAAARECGRELLSSYGLRSLAPSERDYRAQYLGRVWERDSAYHQDPVWAWLLGHYALAEHRIHGELARMDTAGNGRYHQKVWKK